MIDPIITAARFLADHLEWMRHRPECDEFLTDVEAAARIVRGIVRGPAEQRYLGPCGAPAQVETTTFADLARGERSFIDGMPCDGDVYGYLGAEKGTCRTCGAQVDQAERRAWLDEQVAERLADEPIPARDIAFALRLNVKTIRTWATEIRTESGMVIRAAKLRTYYRLGEHVVPWTEPTQGEDVKTRGPRLHYVGDVRELAREAAERRERAEAARRVDMSTG